MNEEFRVRLLLALQVTLLGNIGKNIRAVSCDAIEENIRVRVIFDGKIANEDKEAIEDVGSELASHFEKELVDTQCIQIDAPQSFRNDCLALLVYQRRE